MKPDTKAIRARADAATAAPWDERFETNDNGSWGEVLAEKRLVCECCTTCGQHLTDADRANMLFIAAARADVPALCARVDALEAALANLLDVCKCGNGCPPDDWSCATNRARAVLEGE